MVALPKENALIMSVLKKVFGAKNKKKSSTSSTEDAIQKLHLTEELMIEKQKHFEKKIEHETEVAKQNSTTNKRGRHTFKAIKNILMDVLVHTSQTKQIIYIFLFAILFTNNTINI